MLRALPAGNETLNALAFLIPACVAVLDRCSSKTGSLATFGSLKLACTTPPGNRCTPRLRGSNSRPLRLSVIIARCVSPIESEVRGRLGAVSELKKPDKRGICLILFNKQWAKISRRFYFPLSILHLALVIAVIGQWQMTNVIWKMENEINSP